MPTSETAAPLTGLARLATPAGGFTMLAIDQRVSLETMFDEAGRAPDTDAMDRFRAQVLTVLGPRASAVLVERGLVERGRLPALPLPRPGRILAGERLEQVRGHAATGSSLDPDAPAIAARMGADALKLMAIWRVDAPARPVLDLIDAFVALAHGAGSIAVVEGIVRGRDGVSRDAFLTATAAMARSADLYKAQPPIAGGGTSRRTWWRRRGSSRTCGAVPPTRWRARRRTTRLDCSASTGGACEGTHDDRLLLGGRDGRDGRGKIGRAHV